MQILSTVSLCLYFRNKNWQNQFGFKRNLKIHELSYDFPIDLRERSYRTVYSQRWNAKGIRLKKLACPRDRHECSKHVIDWAKRPLTSSLTFYKIVAPVATIRRIKKSQWLSRRLEKSPVQLAFQKISIYNVLIDGRVRKSDKTDPDRNIFSIRGGSLQTTEFEFEHCNPFLYLFLEKRERDHRCVTKYLARKSKKGLV